MRFFWPKRLLFIRVERGGRNYFALELVPHQTTLINTEFLHICRIFSCSEQKFQDSCNSAGIFDEIGPFL